MADVIQRSPDHKPWQRQRHWKRQSIPSYAEILQITQSYPKLQESALFAIAYLTAGRISEIMPKPYLYKRKYKRGDNGKIIRNKQSSPIIQSTERLRYDYPGIKKRDLNIEEIDGVQILLVSIENRKHLTRRRKSIPIPIDLETDMVAILTAYISNIEFDDVLFPFSESKARLIINKKGFNPHYLRDIRLTHLALNYEYTEYQLMMYAGWTDGRPAAHYIQQNWKALIKPFQRMKASNGAKVPQEMKVSIGNEGV